MPEHETDEERRQRELEEYERGEEEERRRLQEKWDSEA